MQARAATAGAAAILYVGPAGVGKTALLRSFERRTEGAVLIPGRDRRVTSASVSVAGLLALPIQRRPVRRASLRRLDRLWDDDPPEAQAAAGAILACAAAAGATPVVYLIDDLDELDDAGRATVAALVDAATTEPLVVVATSRRPLPDWPARTVPLPPLSDDVICDLLAGEAIHPAVAEQIARFVAGSPLAAQTVTASLTRDQRAGMEPLPDWLPVAPRLVATCAAELRALPAPSRRAVLTRAVMMWFGDDGVDASGSRAHGDTSFEPPHRTLLATQALLLAAAPDERRRAHEEAAALTTGHVALLHQAAAAGHPDDRLAGLLIGAAGDRLAAGDLRTAIELLEAGGGVAEDPSLTGSAWYRAGVGRYLTGGNRRVVELAAAVRALPGAGVPAAHLGRLEGLAGVHIWGFEDTIERLAAEADRAETDGEQAAALALLIIAAAFSLYSCRWDALASFAGRAEALEPGDPLARAAVSVLAASAHLYAAVDPTPLRQLAPALDGLVGPPPSAVLLGLDIDASRSRFFAGLLFLTDERWDEARAVFAMVAAHDRDAGWTALAGLNAAWHAEALWRMGAWSEAIDVARAAIDPANPALGRSRLWLDAFLAKAELITGDLDAAAQHRSAIEANSTSPLRIPLVELSMRAGTAVGLLGAGDLEEALEHLLAAADIAGKGGHPGLVWWRADLVEALASTGRRDEAVAAAESLQELTGKRAPAVLRGRTLRAQGLAVGGRRGLSLLTRAATVHETSGCPFALGRSLLALAEARDALGEDESLVMATASRAQRAFERLGAMAFAARAARVGSGLLATDRLAGLTARELDVVGLVAAGATNQQTASRLEMSPKTVSFHLGSVFRKLRVTSRTELAAVVHDDADAAGSQRGRARSRRRSGGVDPTARHQPADAGHEAPRRTEEE